MNYEYKSQMAYVSADGNYSAMEDTLIFDTDALTNKQWDMVSNMNDNSRFEYVLAILDGDDEYVAELEEENS